MESKLARTSVFTLAAGFIACLIALWPSTSAGTASPSTQAGGDIPHRYACPKGSQAFDSRELTGRKVPFARRGARRHDCAFRIVKRNGKGLPVTADYAPHRINVAVRDRRVVRIVGIG